MAKSAVACFPKGWSPQFSEHSHTVTESIEAGHFCTTKRSVMFRYVERVLCQINSIAFSVKGLISPCRNWPKTQNRALQQDSEILEETAFLRSFTGKERNLFLGRLSRVNSLCYFSLDTLTPDIYISKILSQPSLVEEDCLEFTTQSLLISGPSYCYFCCHSLILKNAFICSHLKICFKSCQRQDCNLMEKMENFKYFCHRNFNSK